MIFVAVGTQFSFDRLIQYMDKWASENNEEVIAQIASGDYIPKNMKWDRFLDGETYNANISKASVFVSHAGMGNIISAREQNTPIIVINRQLKLGEHRNDHQLDGLEWMAKLDGVYTAKTQEDLNLHLANPEKLKINDSMQGAGNQTLSNYIADFIVSD